jgi:hypothetical protein
VVQAEPQTASVYAEAYLSDENSPPLKAYSSVLTFESTQKPCDEIKEHQSAPQPKRRKKR